MASKKYLVNHFQFPRNLGTISELRTGHVKIIKITNL